MYQKKPNPAHQKGQDKLARIPLKVHTTMAPLRKPAWIKSKLPSGNELNKIRKILRENKLNTVCEDASCPNLGECFAQNTATFMIMGDICTRRCPFCDVAHGKPLALDPLEAQHISVAVKKIGLKYVVITSVNRDDLTDGGAGAFADCIRTLRTTVENIKIEILTPDFRGRVSSALEVLGKSQPDVFNHNLETVPRLYKQCRPGADYQHSLALLSDYKKIAPEVMTKSGLMLGLGETIAEVIAVMEDLRAHQVGMLTLGQYLQPSRHHLPVQRYVHPDEFTSLAVVAKKLGFKAVASGAMVRSSYHADQQEQKLLLA